MKHEDGSPVSLEEAVGWCYTRARKPNGPKGCWIWPGEGTRRITVDGETKLAHHLLWEYNKGTKPARGVLFNTCGVRRCIRPDHYSEFHATAEKTRGPRAPLTAQPKDSTALEVWRTYHPGPIPETGDDLVRLRLRVRADMEAGR